MVTLWNDIRLAYGRPPLGFINPFLYQLQAQTPTAFRDVVTGNNVRGRGRRFVMSCHVIQYSSLLPSSSCMYSVYLSIYLSVCVCRAAVWVTLSSPCTAATTRTRRPQDGYVRTDHYLQGSI